MRKNMTAFYGKAAIFFFVIGVGCLLLQYAISVRIHDLNEERRQSAYNAFLMRQAKNEHIESNEKNSTVHLPAISDKQSQVKPREKNQPK
ncbi:MAG TPA: hypothetical protein V6C76_00435 [Drouetiella sp.]